MEQPQLIMNRSNLLDLPPIELPPGYAIRSFNDGDEQLLVPIFQECFDPGWSAERVIKTFVEDACWSPVRMAVLVHGDEVVGTSTAWESSQRRGHGMVHYVAVASPHRGKKLGRMIVIRTLELLETMGYPDAWLSTDDWRLAAIKVYLSLGFWPVNSNKTDPERWEIVRHKLALGSHNR